jgi:hypothetical protein
MASVNVARFAAIASYFEVFCAHDADAYGTMIYQTLQEETKARGARKIQIVNIGLEPWEAIEMGLEVEKVEVKKNKEGEEIHKPVADYVKAADEDDDGTAPDGDSWMIGCRPTASN